MFNDKDDTEVRCPKIENLGLDDPHCYKIQETDCGDIAGVETCLNVRTSYNEQEYLRQMGLNHLIR